VAMTGSDERDISLLAQDQYMREVWGLARLSREEEQVCIQRVMAGRAERSKAVPDERVLALARQARDRLIEDRQPVVVAFARRYARFARSLEWLDLVNEGNVGLVVALEHCDLRPGGEFGKLVNSYVRGYMLIALQDRDGVVRVPRRTCDELRGFGRVREALRQELGREPGYDELAQRLGVALSRVCWLVEVERGRRVHSLQALLAEDEAGEDERDFVSLFQAARREQRSYEAALSEDLQRALQAQVTPSQQQVLRLRYGLETGEELTLVEAAQVLGKQPGAVHMAERRAKARLREALAPVVAVAQESLAV
jgi:RNA polymerase sigma factor (sigma-70 family)